MPLDRWPERLAGRAVERVDTHGKHLFLRFEGDLVLHSHLGMIGVWGVYGPGASLAALADGGRGSCSAPATTRWSSSTGRCSS